LYRPAQNARKRKRPLEPYYYLPNQPKILHNNQKIKPKIGMFFLVQVLPPPLGLDGLAAGFRDGRTLGDADGRIMLGLAEETLANGLVLGVAEDTTLG
jgi:hypothetical protein